MSAWHVLIRMLFTASECVQLAVGTMQAVLLRRLILNVVLKPQDLNYKLNQELEQS